MTLEKFINKYHPKSRSPECQMVLEYMYCHHLGSRQRLLFRLKHMIKSFLNSFKRFIEPHSRSVETSTFDRLYVVVGIQNIQLRLLQLLSPFSSPLCLNILCIYNMLCASRHGPTIPLSWTSNLTTKQTVCLCLHQPIENMINDSMRIITPFAKHSVRLVCNKTRNLRRRRRRRRGHCHRWQEVRKGCWIKSMAEVDDGCETANFALYLYKKKRKEKSKRKTHTHKHTFFFHFCLLTTKIALRFRFLSTEFPFYHSLSLQFTFVWCYLPKDDLMINVRDSELCFYAWYFFFPLPRKRTPNFNTYILYMYMEGYLAQLVVDSITNHALF